MISVNTSHTCTVLANASNQIAHTLRMNFIFCHSVCSLACIPNVHIITIMNIILNADASLNIIHGADNANGDNSNVNSYHHFTYTNIIVNNTG